MQKSFALFAVLALSCLLFVPHAGAQDLLTLIEEDDTLGIETIDTIQPQCTNGLNLTLFEESGLTIQEFLEFDGVGDGGISNDDLLTAFIPCIFGASDDCCAALDSIYGPYPDADLHNCLCVPGAFDTLLESSAALGEGQENPFGSEPFDLGALFFECKARPDFGVKFDREDFCDGVIVPDGYINTFQQILDIQAATNATFEVELTQEQQDELIAAITELTAFAAPPPEGI